jgi:hypothetical protein
VAISFKSDESFLRKLAVGAAGTNATIARLKETGFDPVELERGSTGFKIWKRIKIKRVRVPDILCLKTGLRFESRGKTKVEISMSHSLNDPRRAWDAGMRDDDFVSIVVFRQGEDSPVDLEQTSPVHFINVRHLRETFAANQISVTRPKGAEEGSEIRVIWPCAAAKQRSSVSRVEPGKIILTPIPDAQRQCIQLSRTKGTIKLLPQVKPGDIIEANQIVAAVVPVETSLACPSTVDEGYFMNRLLSMNLSERYSAAKALRYRGYSAAEPALVSRMTDVNEDIYVQLEAAAALAAHDDQRGWEYIEQKVRSPVMAVPLETQLETIIVASEVHKERSERLLMEVLEDSSRDDELRAGAAWALGQFPSGRSATALVDTFNSSPLEIKIEAARALLRIAEPQVSHLVRLLQSSDAAKRDGISWVLARTGRFNPLDLIAGADDNLRRWMGYIIGYGKDRFLQTDLEAICKADPEVYFAASVLWQVLASWVNDLTEY